MAVDEVVGQAWTRKHDDPALPVVPAAPRTLYPKSLEELIEICSTRKAFERIHAAGSHWALSTAAIADSVFVETHDPTNQHQAMGRTLYEVVPPCLNADFVQRLTATTVAPYDTATISENEGLYPMHIETGKRVYQLYAELDAGDTDPASLAELIAARGNTSYRGPWGFRTLGGAGGQTVFGALTTGTHGGDFRTPPIADSVMALHLVADGGKHYWIEPESLTPLGVRMTDNAPLQALYGQAKYGGPNNFAVIRDDNVFNSVLIPASRFGIVYSIVVAAVRQYTLHQERRLTTWQAIRAQITNPASPLYTSIGDAITTPALPPTARNRFLQVGVCLTTHSNFTLNLAGVTKRCNVPLAPSAANAAVPAGRAERVGALVDPFDAMLQAPRFDLAGNSVGYSPDPAVPGGAAAPSFLVRACSDGRFMEGVIKTVLMELDAFVKTNGVAIGATIAAVAAIAGPAGGALLLSLLAPLAILVIVLAAIVAVLAATTSRFGEVLNDVASSLLNRADPAERVAGVFVWQMIAFETFRSQQSNQDFRAISYAVMDGHDYFDRSCNINVDSIEAFFDATSPMLPAYVDALIAFEAAQEVSQGRAFVGYASLRFMGPTRALIGQHRFPVTCAVEVAGLRDVAGVTPLINFAITFALNNNVRAILHWGQRNPATVTQIESRFGDTPTNPGGPLASWRRSLSRVTENGQLDGFSCAFTRQTGLEIVQPQITDLSVAVAGAGQPLVITWDCNRNPPSTDVRLEVIRPGGAQTVLMSLPRVGVRNLVAAQSGVYSVTLIAGIGQGARRRQVSRQEFAVIP